MTACARVVEGLEEPLARAVGPLLAGQVKIRAVMDAATEAGDKPLMDMDRYRCSWFEAVPETWPTRERMFKGLQEPENNEDYDDWVSKQRKPKKEEEE